MKLLVIIPSLHRGGAERVVSLLTQEWSKEHDGTLAVFDASHQAYAHGGQLVTLNTPSTKSNIISKLCNALLRIVRLVKLIHQERPERIISFMESANFPTIIASIITNRLDRLVVSVHLNPAYCTFVHRYLIALLYGLPKTVIAVSQGVSDALSNMKVPDGKLCFIPNPINPHAIQNANQRPTAPEKYILTVGRLHHQKGFDYLLHAFASLVDSGVHLVILGEGGERNALENLSRFLGIEQRVHLLGAVDNVAIWYEHAYFALNKSI